MFRTIITVKDFKKACKELKKVKKPLTTSISTKDNKTTITSYNNNNKLDIALDSEVLEEGNIVLDEGLMKLLNKLKNNELNFNKEEGYVFNDNKKIKINNGNVDDTKNYCKFAFDNNDNKIDSFSISSRELLKLLEVSYCRSKDETRPILQGVNFKNNKACAVDRYRFSIRTSNELNINSDFTINSEAIDILLSLLKADDSIVKFNLYDKGNNEGVVLIDFNNYRLISLVTIGNYIKYESLVNLSECKKNIIKIKDVKSFIESLDFMKEIKTYNNTWSNKETSIMKLSLSDENMVIKSNENEVEEKLNYSEIIKQNDITLEEIGINTEYLLEGMKNYKDNKELYIMLNSPVEPIIITDNINNEDNIEFILPVRLLNR